MTAPSPPRVGRFNIRIDRVIYTTITLMSVLIIYDGWATLRFWDVLAVVLGPILAIFLSHAFGAELGTRVALGRPLTGAERRGVIAEESRYLLILIPPLLILAISSLVGLSYTRTINVIVLVGVLSLGFWGAVAGRRAGLTGWSLLGATCFGLAIGCVILVLQALLQPGHNPFLP